MSVSDLSDKILALSLKTREICPLCPRRNSNCAEAKPVKRFSFICRLCHLKRFRKPRLRRRKKTKKVVPTCHQNDEKNSGNSSNGGEESDTDWSDEQSAHNHPNQLEDEFDQSGIKDGTYETTKNPGPDEQETDDEGEPDDNELDDLAEVELLDWNYLNAELEDTSHNPEEDGGQNEEDDGQDNLAGNFMDSDDEDESVSDDNEAEEETDDDCDFSSDPYG